jgi:hypothetical protein
VVDLTEFDVGTKVTFGNVKDDLSTALIISKEKLYPAIGKSSFVMLYYFLKNDGNVISWYETDKFKSVYKEN